MVDLVLQENKWNEKTAIKATDLHEWLGIKTKYMDKAQSSTGLTDEGKTFIDTTANQFKN